jgi:endonuclease/exonuclease/phosphatase family metal-dependent hydrolase
MGFFLILNFANAFAFTYPYTLPFLRGYGWAVYLVAGLAAGLPLLAPRSAPTAAPRLRWPALVAGIVVVLACEILVWPHSTDNRVDVRAVRAATYNIHYGYDQRWGFHLAELANTIRAEGVDFIALQEVDTGRMTSYMADDAYYLARALGMHEAYLPTVERLTGIAVLYRGSSESIERILVTSRQEQTGVVHVEAGVDGRAFHMFGIWMGLSDEDTLRQIEEALAFLGDRAPAAFGGDFNAEPDSPVVERVLAAGLHDPFADLDIDPAPLTDPAVDPDKRIDFVFLRGATPRQAWVSTSLASDHRMVVVELDLTLPPLPDVVRR